MADHIFNSFLSPEAIIVWDKEEALFHFWETAKYYIKINVKINTHKKKWVKH